MRQVHVRALILAALAVQLGGCSSFLGIRFARSAPAEPSVRVAPTTTELAARAPATEAGRSQLAASLPGAAIEAFQRALATGEPIAPAVNGLGVAYARIGRLDLAKRFFEQAMATDPANSRYAENLSWLMASPAMAKRIEREMAAAVIRAAEASAPLPAAIRATQAAPVAGRLQRVSRGEVRIATAPPQAAPARPAGRLASSDANDRFKPLVRITFADREEPAAPSVIRIQLPEPKPVNLSSQAAGSSSRH